MDYRSGNLLYDTALAGVRLAFSDTPKRQQLDSCECWGAGGDGSMTQASFRSRPAFMSRKDIDMVAAASRIRPHDHIHISPGALNRAIGLDD